MSNICTRYSPLKVQLVLFTLSSTANTPPLATLSIKKITYQFPFNRLMQDLYRNLDVKLLLASVTLTHMQYEGCVSYK